MIDIFSHFFLIYIRGADICRKCWLFMVVAMKIVDSALESKFKITETFFIKGKLFSMS